MGSFLSVDRMGKLRMSWLEAKDGLHKFQLSEYQGAGWGPVTTVAQGANLLANWADVPATFVTSRDVLAAHWLERGQGREAYFVRLRTSADGGRTWTPVVTPHRDDSPSEHGFVSFFEAPGSGLGLIWLDGREIAAKGRQGSMNLRTTFIGGSAPGQPGDDAVIDPRVCDCCQTSAARTDRGVIVAYRDRSAEEIRDISVSRLVDGRWTEPMTVGTDRWQINACPVNGPVVVASGRAVALAWFTMGGDNTPRTRVAFSSDSGETFGAPIDFHGGTTFGRLDMVMLDADRVLVSSIERHPESGRFVVREVRRNGRLGDSITVAQTSTERASGFPRLAVSGRRVWFAWTEVRTGAPPQVRVASARLK